MVLRFPQFNDSFLVFLILQAFKLSLVTMWEERQRSVLVEGTEALNRTSASLTRAEQCAVETESLGTNVISELAEQRETLLRASNRLGDVETSLTKSQQLINFMKRGVLMNKVILVVIIISEICILAALIYLKFIRH
ncbi:vesicle transport through interaction with t-SNAREs homolog 1B [Cimex lectularius]|uniref:Uncharacterized protein n=1 Tax=Cimex lectularius TaxID=79782 RepID=A0A8I6STR7_CIMLE|nr:vesicle transport through interaction with t-SNAREs homolog 1B [Cimex lectularius]